MTTRMNLTPEQTAWLQEHGIKASRYYEGFHFFRADSHGYAVGSVVEALPLTDGTLRVEVRGRSKWERHLACWTAPRPRPVRSLRHAMAYLLAEALEGG